MQLTSFLLLFLFLPLKEHAIYLSLVDLDLQAKQMTVKVFSDDLQNALKNFDSAFDPMTALKNNQLVLEKYFQYKLILKVNNDSVDLSFSNSSVENDAHFLTFSFQYAKSISIIHINADYFMELFPTQSNVISIKNGEEQHFLRLTKDKSDGRVDFNR